MLNVVGGNVEKVLPKITVKLGCDMGYIETFQENVLNFTEKMNCFHNNGVY